MDVDKAASNAWLTKTNIFPEAGGFIFSI